MTIERGVSRAAAIATALLSTLLGMQSVSHAATGTLYAVTGSGGDQNGCAGSLSTLYTIDPTNGAATAVGPVMIGSTQVRHITGLAVHPSTGVLYAISNGQQNDCSDDGLGTLYTIDPATAEATIVGSQNSLGNPGFYDFKMPDMAFDPFGTLYAWNEYDGDSLWEIDITNGTGSRIAYGPNSYRTGLASDSKGRLYVKIDYQLYQLNPANAAYFNFVEIDRELINVLAFDQNDALFSGQRTTDGFDLYSINRTTGATTYLGSNTVKNIGAITFDRGTLTAPPVADLSVTKQVDDSTPKAGENVVFTLTVFNEGPDAATNVVVRDVLASGYSYVTSSGDGTYDDQTGLWTIANIDNGSSAVITITVQVLNQPGADFTNTAELIGSDAYDPDSVPDSGLNGEDDYGQETTTPIFPSLFSIDRDTNLLWVIDPTFQYTDNAMNITLDGSTIDGGTALARQPGTDTLFAVLKTDTGRKLTTIDPTDGTVTAVGALGTRAVAGIAFADQTTLYAVTGDAGSNPRTVFSVDPSDASMTALCTVPGEYGASLAYSDGILYYVTEVCPFDCFIQVHAIDTASLPADPADPCGGTVYDTDLFYYEPTGLTLEQDAGGTVSLLLSTFSFLFRVELSGGDSTETFLGYLSHYSKGLAFASVDVTVGNLTTSKSSAKMRVKGAELIDYTITATKNGPDSVDNVTLTDNLPSGVTLVSNDANCDFDGGSVTCDISTLGPGTTQFFTFTVQVTCKKCSSISNYVGISADDAFFDNPYDNTSGTTTNVKGKF